MRQKIVNGRGGRLGDEDVAEVARHGVDPSCGPACLEDGFALLITHFHGRFGNHEGVRAGELLLGGL